MVPLHLVTDLANRVGENRIIAGLHYPHDHTVGQAVANSIFALLNTKFTTSGNIFYDLMTRAKVELQNDEADKP